MKFRQEILLAVIDELIRVFEIAMGVACGLWIYNEILSLWN